MTPTRCLPRDTAFGNSEALAHLYVNVPSGRAFHLALAWLVIAGLIGSVACPFVAYVLLA